MEIRGYKQCNGNHTLFYPHFPAKGVTILIVYVDDIIITGNNDVQAIKLEEHLTSHFEVKKLGPLKYFMGIEKAQFTNGYLMTQQKYKLDLLNVKSLKHGKTSKTRIEMNHRLTLIDNIFLVQKNRLTLKEDDPKIEIHSYQKLIGKLLYLAHTPPNISYSVNVFS